MDTLRAMKALVRTVELGSISAAARSLASTQPTVSKLLAELETRVGVTLLDRNSARVRPTHEGERLLETARRMLEDYDEALVELQGQRVQPHGTVRLAAPLALGQCWLNERLPLFLERYPDIRLEVMLEDRFVDVVQERIDLSLRIGGEHPPHLVARHVATWPRWLVASPAYLHHKGCPTQPADLAQHSVLSYTTDAADELTLQDGERRAVVAVRSRYRINNALALLQCVERGLGVALQPSWAVARRIQDGQLVRVLPPWCGPDQVAYLLFQPRQRQPARVAVLLDFLMAELGPMAS